MKKARKEMPITGPDGYRRRLWVEGASERLLLPELLEKQLGYWLIRKAAESSPAFAVHLQDQEGWANCLRPESVLAILQDPMVDRFGIVVDGDQEPGSRVRSFTSIFGDRLEQDQESPPHTILGTCAGKRVGLFVMPGGGRQGMLETLLAEEASRLQPSLMEHARHSTTESKAHGAEFADLHYDKALLHTWLAWQEQPGCAPHIRVTRPDVQPSTDGWRLFFDWFTRLFQLEAGSPPDFDDVHGIFAPTRPRPKDPHAPHT